ncbi:MAG: hypothetical protein FJ222_06730 [Lentisphaerae bacterium]|nr:hypothetical protein [Lentisphaerota bacterium]
MFCSTRLCLSLAVLSALLATLGCASRRDGASSCPPAPQPDNVWCETARYIASTIPSDLHDVERNRALADIAAVALDVGSDEQTQRIASEITGWRRGDLLARLATRCYQSERLMAGDRLRTAAEEVAHDPSLETWQASRVKLALERAKHARPASTGSSAVDVNRLEPADQAALLPDLMNLSVARSSLLETLVRLEAVTNQVLDLDAAASTVDAYRVVYQKASADAVTDAYRDRVFAGMTRVFKSLHPALACDKMVEFGETALRFGDTNLVLRLCGEVDARLGGIRADMRLPVQIRYARLLSQAGLSERAHVRLNEVGGWLSDPAVLASERPGLLATLGVAWNALGDTASASSRWHEACTALTDLKNARPRAVAAVQVCLVFARAQVSDGELERSLRAVGEGLGEPW